MTINDVPSVSSEGFAPLTLSPEIEERARSNFNSFETPISSDSRDSLNPDMPRRRSISIGSITPYANLDYEDCNLEYETAPEYNVDSISNACIKTIKTWANLKKTDLKIERHTFGTSSIIYIIEHKSKSDYIKPKKVILRIYSPKVKELYDGSIENEVFEAMASYNLGPKLIGYGGRIEEWIDGYMLTHKMLHNVTTLNNIAKLISVLHRRLHPSQTPFHWDRRPALIHYINRWSNASLKSPEIIQKIVNLKSLIHEKNIYCTALVRYVKDNFTFPFNLAFCHNDLHENNIFVETYTNNYRLIDFEYAGFNYLGCDIANVILECMIEYDTKLPQKFKVHYDNPMPDYIKRHFIASYISNMVDEIVEVDDEEVDIFLNAVKILTIGLNLFWGFWSVLRSIAGPSKRSSLDYIKFANEHFMMYMKGKLSLKSDFKKYIEEAEKELKEDKLQLSS